MILVNWYRMYDFGCGTSQVLQEYVRTFAAISSMLLVAPLSNAIFDDSVDVRLSCSELLGMTLDEMLKQSRHYTDVLACDLIPLEERALLIVKMYAWRAAFIT